MMASFCALFFPRDVLDDILNLIESFSEGFPTYSFRDAHRRGKGSDPAQPQKKVFTLHILDVKDAYGRGT